MSDYTDALIAALKNTQVAGMGDEYGGGGRVGTHLPNGMGIGATGMYQKGQRAALQGVDATLGPLQANFDPRGRPTGAGVTVPMGGGNLTARYDRNGTPMIQNAPVGQEHTAQDPMRNMAQMPTRDLLQLMYSKDF